MDSAFSAGILVLTQHKDIGTKSVLGATKNLKLYRSEFSQLLKQSIRSEVEMEE